MARSAPAPNVGPKLIELKTALFSSIKFIFCLRESENKKDYLRTSACRVFAVDFQGMVVNPPMTLLN